MVDQLSFSIGDMHCDACVRRVSNALSGLPGVRVQEVKVGSAQVAYDASLMRPEEILAAVDRIGFKAKAAD